MYELRKVQYETQSIQKLVKPNQLTNFPRSNSTHT